MRHIASRILLAAGILLSLSHGALAATDIQMLPPTAQGSTPTTITPCASLVSGSPSLLGWDGTNPINCITGIYVSPTGQLGIGTSSPGGLLDVEGSGGVTLNAGNVAIGSSGNPAEIVNQNQYGEVAVGVDSSLHVSTNGYKGQASALVVSSNLPDTWISFGDATTSDPPVIGSAGNSFVIGTAPAGLELGRFVVDQNGNITVPGDMGLSGASGGSPYLVVGAGPGAGPANTFAYFAANGAGYSLITGGRIESMSDINTQTGYMVGGTCVLGTCASDIRVKDHVRPFKPGLDALLAMNPIYYRLNGLGGTLKSDHDGIGVIAQDVEKGAAELVVPKNVVMQPGDKQEVELKQVNYTGLQYVVINAVKELYGKWSDDHEMLVTLKAENDELRNEVADLKARFAKN